MSNYSPDMGKKKKSSGARKNERQRINPLTGATEIVSGTKAGKKRSYLPFGHPLRTHDLSAATRALKNAQRKFQAEKTQE